jgi:RHH-type transcriptional regulator, proline utilization regulon repressor / proline dehydrogenase / delta 1-pyrroline-5-carboxylate dehydrogenase
MALFSKKKSVTPSSGPAGVSRVQQPALGPVDAAREKRILEIGGELLSGARDHRSGVLSAKFYKDKLMDWSMKDHDFKVQLFRFVDTFPVLHTPEQVHTHLMDYLTQPGVKLPAGMDLGLKAGGVAKGIMSRTIAGQIEGMAKTFIAGTDAASALSGLRKLWDDEIAFSVDLLGEACLSDAEADEYQAKYLDLVQNLPATVAAWPAKPRLESDHLGRLPRTNVSIKVSSLSARANPIDTEGAIADLMRRIEPILEVARDKGVLINFDMEQFDLKDLTIELFKRCCERVDFQAGIAIQAYLKSGEADARDLAQWAVSSGRIVTVRLIKGAYWDYETIHAEDMGWPCPVWNLKWQTDLCFERMAEIFLDSTPRSDAQRAPTEGTALGPTRREKGRGGIKLALGSHNARSIAAALAGLDARGLPRDAIELQMLHGMADQLKHAAADSAKGLNLRVREYVPVGEMIPGMAYLVRRLLENTSNESWLRAGFLDDANETVLLAAPGPKMPLARSEPVRGDATHPDAHPDLVSGQDLTALAPERHKLSPAIKGVGDGRPFINEPMRDFADTQTRRDFAAAVERSRVRTVEIKDDDALTERALEQATANFASWRDTDPKVRAGLLVRLAGIMRTRRDELSGIVVKESGKTWREADADVCEAIDFCEFYARTAMPLFERSRLGRFIGELDETWYQPRGVAAVISPWNFPLAIATGMAVAALVTGNTVILKPAEQTPAIAAELESMLVAAGCPKGVFHLLAGTGERTGAKLVRDPRVALIAFTGSKAVGLDILQAAGHTPMGQPFVKRVICEMGGKNAVIVDTSADLDEAVKHLRHAAFGFQGQKCSACSRIIIVDPQGAKGEHSQTFVRRYTEAMRALVVGDPVRSGTDIGPVIDAEAKSKIMGYIERGKSRGLACIQLDVPDGLESLTGRFFVPPTVFTDVAENDELAREEIFGPVVAVLHARDFDDALRIANGVPYKLTGGVFTRMPTHIEQAKREFRVGNLYINRANTGALVGRHPFGGFGMSGVGSKAGGLDYLLQFVEPRACAENTMRRGFAPEL